METDTVMAYQVEKNDILLIDGETFTVTAEPEEDEDFILFTTKDDEEETTQFPFGPFQTLSIVTRFEDDVEVEDVPIEG